MVMMGIKNHSDEGKKEFKAQSSFTNGNFLSSSEKKQTLIKEELEEETIRLKPIRKDVFHFIKAVLEESRIFLPMKLPFEESILKHYREKSEYEASTCYGSRKASSTGSSSASMVVENPANDQQLLKSGNHHKPAKLLQITNNSSKLPTIIAKS